MTLDGMNRYLIERGFEVTRERDTANDAYIFMIDDGSGFTLAGSFKYPGNKDWPEKGRIMTSFLDRLIRDYKKHKEEENNYMERITWRVEAVELHQADSKSLPCLEVSLAGFVDNARDWTFRRRDDVIRNIEDKMNRNDGRISLNSNCTPAIKDVIFNPPATIVLWNDGTKTVVKCQDGDEYDAEKGLAMAIAKKALGNQGNYCNVIKKWTEPYYEKEIMKLQQSFLLNQLNLPDYSTNMWNDILDNFKKSFTRIGDASINASSALTDVENAFSKELNDRETFFKGE